MKKWWVNILFLWGMLILAPGCIKENFDDCFQGPYEIYFLYNGNGTTDIFNSKIETVLLYVFDTDGGYVDRYAVSKAALHEFQGIRPDLQPGAYEVVCWGNVTALSEITGGEGTLEEHFLYNRIYLSGGSIVNFDSLYYGRQTIEVPVRTAGPDTVYFRSAHIKIEVYIEGLATTESEVQARAMNDPQGWLTVRNVYTGYDFRMEVTGETAAMYPGWTGDSPGNQLTSRFNLFRFGDDNDILIDVYNEEGRLVYSLDLANFMSWNHITVEGINEVTIPVYLRFDGGLNVHVSVKGWESGFVDPVF
ncbi:MAG: FimB/Mfa2 family fimbrial subunit [Tannerellaceae bacterium]|nr:FimB/Mfa2 family fimbrial subunit [Tannerellaceae bacterium]